MKTPIAFTRMNGLGNDFIIIDAQAGGLSLSSHDVRALADRHNAVTKGCDQLLVIHPPRDQSAAQIFMQIFNADGSEVEACGNGARAVAAFMVRQGADNVVIQTLGGTLSCRTALDGQCAQVTIDMPLPQFGDALSLDTTLPDALPVNMGNPHAVIFVDDATSSLAATKGPQLERHSAFAQGANINFATVSAPQIVRLDTWERGAGLTLACGTGACATAAAAVQLGHCKAGKVIIRPPYNQDDNEEDVIVIDYLPDAHLTMTGPVAFEFDGEMGHGEVTP